eukprot:25566_1
MNINYCCICLCVSSCILLCEWIDIITIGIVIHTFAIYLTLNTIIHLLIHYYSKSYKSHDKPQHLIVFVTGYLTPHFLQTPILNSFKRYYEQNYNNNKQGIMVHLASSNTNGFFTHSFYGTNDGIHKGGQRLSDEIKSVLHANPSLDKISIIGSSLGGLYSRYCFKSLFDSQCTINGRRIKPINFITLASPHMGCSDWTEQSKLNLFGYAVSLRDIAKALLPCRMVPATLQQLLLLDQEKIIIEMALKDEYLKPLELFENRVCFGNARYDNRVSCSSSLLFGAQQANIGIQFWDKMVTKNDTFLLEKVAYSKEKPAQKDTNDDWFCKLIGMEWNKFIVCWNQNVFVRKNSHRLLANPRTWYSGCKPVFDTINSNFIF